MSNKSNNSRLILDTYIDNINACIRNFSSTDLFNVLEIMQETYKKKRMVFIFGNGGSAATSSHIAEDLSKGCYCEGKPAFRAISLTDNTPLLTALSNDISYSSIFEKQLEIIYTPGDAVFAISASGNSENVIRGVNYAKLHGAKIISLTGFSGGKLKGISDANIHIPSDHFGPIEDMHLMVGHILSIYMKSYIKDFQVE